MAKAASFSPYFSPIIDSLHKNDVLTKMVASSNQKVTVSYRMSYVFGWAQPPSYPNHSIAIHQFAFCLITFQKQTLCRHSEDTE
jgi:hypothetical protein